MHRHHTVRVDRQSTLVAEPVSLDGSLRNHMEREGWYVGRWGARGGALDRLLGYEAGANTWTTIGQKSQSSSTSVRRRALGSKGGAREEHWCWNLCSQRCDTLALARKVPTDIAAKTAGNDGIEHEAKGRFRGFRGTWNSIQQVCWEFGQALKRLDITLDASKLFHPVIRGILVLGTSGLNGSEVRARSWPLKKTALNTIVYWRSSGRIVDSSSETATRRKATRITAMAGPVNLLPTTTSWQSGSVQRRNRLTNQTGHLGLDCPSQRERHSTFYPQACLSGIGIWDSGAKTSMFGFLGLEAIRDSHVTSRMEDSFEIDTDPEKQISYTYFHWRLADEQFSL